MPKTAKTELAPIEPDTPNSLSKDISIEAIIGLYLKGKSQAEISRQLGCSRANISERLGKYEEDVKALPDFKRNKADMLAMYQRRILNTLTPEDIEKQSAYQRVGMFSILFDKERLERDLSTDNVSHDVLIGDASDKRQAYELAVKARIKAQED